MPTIQYQDRHKVHDGKTRITELSGLSADETGQLWLVSDNQKKLFLLDDNFQVKRHIKLKLKDLEGIATGPDGSLGALTEPGQLFNISPSNGKVIQQWDLSSWIPSEQPNKKGFEGLCWNGDYWVAVTEKPRELIAIKQENISALCDLEQVPGLEANSDCSGICWDAQRSCYWIVSHQASSAVLLDPESWQIMAELKLKYRKKGKWLPVPQAEGIAIIDSRLFIACDHTSRCYEYQICD